MVSERVKLPHLARQVLCRPRVHVPVWIDGVGLSVSLLLLRRRTINHGNLTGKVACVLAIIAKTKKTPLKAFVTLGGLVPLNATQLTHASTTGPWKSCGRRGGRRWRGRGRGRPLGRVAATLSGSVRREGAVTGLGVVRLDTLLGEEKAGVDLICLHGSRVAPLIDDPDQSIILLVEPVDDEGVELGVGERLSNGGQRVSKTLDLVVELRGRGVKLLALAKLTTECRDAGLRLHRK